MLNRKGTKNTKGLMLIGAGIALALILYFVVFSTGNSFVTYTRKAVPDVQEAAVYNDLVGEILKEKCVSCHGENKHKGKLRLDNPEMILKGGKSGQVLEAGSPDESELFIRIMYPLNDDDHMPPKDKDQLSKADIALLHWWIKEGNDFTKKVKDIQQNDSIKKLLASFQKDTTDIAPVATAVPNEKVKAGKPAVIERLKAMGITVMPVAEGNNYLTVSFLNTKVNPDTVLAMLLPLKDQVIFLKLSGSKVSDEGATAIAGLHQLTRLYLDNTKVTDAGISKLTTLKQLQYLNLTGTAVTKNGILALKNLMSLQTLYLYQTQVKTEDFILLKQSFPGVVIDSGRYVLPFKANDTVVNR